MNATSGSHAVFVIGNILPQNGGVTNAVYARASALASEFERVTILTLQLDLEFDAHVAWHRQRRSFDPKIDVLNIYESGGRKIRDKVKAPFVPEYSYFADSKRSNAYRVFDSQGCYVRYEARRADGVLEFVDYFSTPWNRWKKSYFDRFGVCRRDLYLSADGTKAEFQVIRDGQGRPVASSKLNGDGRPISYFFHEMALEFKTEIDIAVPIVQSMIESSSRACLFIDKREFVAPLSSVSSAGLKKIFVMHSNHLDHPFDEIARISPSAKPAFEALESGDIDHMVLLTEYQAGDVKSVVNSRDRISVINNFIDRSGSRGVETSKRDPLLVVALARYHYAKNLAAALEVFQVVHKKIPDARFEIFGYGPELEGLKQYAKSLGVLDSVSFNGHSDSPLAELSRASVTLLTSRYEGMPLTLLEAMSVGTPAVAFDIKYGPRDIIRGGVDGVLVPQTGDRIQAAGDAVIELLTDAETWRSFSCAARSVDERFSIESARREWRDLISRLYSSS